MTFKLTNNLLTSPPADEKSELGMEELMAEVYILRAIHEKVHIVNCSRVTNTYQYHKQWLDVPLNKLVQCEFDYQPKTRDS